MAAKPATAAAIESRGLRNAKRTSNIKKPR